MDEQEKPVISENLDIDFLVEVIEKLSKNGWKIHNDNDDLMYTSNKVYTVVAVYGKTKAYYSMDAKKFFDISSEYVCPIIPILVKVG